jgi:hypothetical protein
LEQAGMALEYAEKYTQMNYPLPRQFVQSYWLLAEALLQCQVINSLPHSRKAEIHFYDESFHEPIESLPLQKGNELSVAERCLSEALRRCRSVNLVQMEPNLLLAWARLVRQKAKGKEQEEKGKQQKEKNNKAEFNQIEEYVKEAREIAERAEYRLALADIHLFCAEVGLERQKENGKRQKEKSNTNSFLGLSLDEHLHKAKEYALDVSEYAHLYQSRDPHFYDGIPEAAMLKRGLTEQERIDNGYWVAYQIALALEQRLAALQ